MSSILKSSKYLEVTYEKRGVGYPRALSGWIKKNIFKKTGRLLDVGYGHGDYLRAFSDLQYNVCGADLSPTLIRPFDCRIVDIEERQYPKEEFDFVFSKSVIEHVKNVDNATKFLYDSLKVGGKLVVMTPSWEYTSFGPFYNDHTHVTPFTKTSLENILKMHNFKNIQVDYFYQLPFVWKYPFLKYFCKLINFLKIPYKDSKLIRFSREVMLLAIADKL